MSSEEKTITDLLTFGSQPPVDVDYFAREQLKDLEVLAMVKFLDRGCLPTEEAEARKIASQEPSFSLLDGVLYFVDVMRGSVL